MSPEEKKKSWPQSREQPHKKHLSSIIESTNQEQNTDLKFIAFPSINSPRPLRETASKKSVCSPFSETNKTHQTLIFLLLPSILLPYITRRVIDGGSFEKE